MPKAIICLGTRTSTFNSSLSEERALTLCAQYDVVINEIHRIDSQDRNLTCVWDIFVTNPYNVGLIQQLLTNLSTSHWTRDDRAFATPYVVLAFSWHGHDNGRETRPPEKMKEVLDRLADGLRALGFEISTDNSTQEQR